jgi:hypothetical protein
LGKVTAAPGRPELVRVRVLVRVVALVEALTVYVVAVAVEAWGVWVTTILASFPYRREGAPVKDVSLDRSRDC